MYFQRAGVAGSPVLQLIPTSSLSVELNEFIPLGLIRCSLEYLLSKEAYDLSSLHEAAFVRMLQNRVVP